MKTLEYTVSTRRVVAHGQSLWTDCAFRNPLTFDVMKIVFRHILFFFVFLNAVWAFTHKRRLSYRLRYTCIGIGKYLRCVKIFPLGGVRGAKGQEPDLHRIFAFQ